MADHTPQRAIVIGGSLGGLFAAAALREIGWTVDVYERSVNELDSRGGGIVMQRDLLEAFRFAGFAHGPQFSVPSRDRQFLVASGAARFRQRMPQAQTAWNVLYNTLRAGLPEGVVHAGLALSGIEQDGARVEAILSNGERARAHLF